MKSKTRSTVKKYITSYAFVLPAMILNLVLFLYPFLQTVVMSFYDWPILGAKKFILFDNYARLFGDEQFIKSLVFTLKYALFVTPSLFLRKRQIINVCKKSTGCSSLQTVLFENFIESKISG